MSSAEIGKVIVGQQYMIERLLIGLLANGHVLLEGVPGLAKTTGGQVPWPSRSRPRFQRIQFTPDLLPADLIGTHDLQPAGRRLHACKKGPIFANIILADEINRAPAKVQSALLEAMQERQVTIGEQTFPLAEPFLVLATQNPIEQEGTYPLPEAQVDRFMLKLMIDLSQPGGGARRSWTAWPDGPAARRSSRSSTPEDILRGPGGRATRSTWTTRSRTTSWTSCCATRDPEAYRPGHRAT